MASATAVGVQAQSPNLHESNSLTNNYEVGYTKGIVKALRIAASAARKSAGNLDEEKQEKSDIMYKKARVYMNCRPKRVLFNVHHRLYQSGDLEQDVKQLRTDQYEGVAPPASIIWGERFDQDVLQSSKALSEGNFWPFVHSVAWSRFSSIRVTEGALLDSLLYAYYTLLQDGKLFSYVTQVFKNNVRTRSGKNSDKESKETIKIMFTYYAPSLKTLSDVIFRHHGSRISIDALAAHNENQLKFDVDSPDMPLDLTWSNDQSPIAPSRMTQHTPVNPPNSPTPSASPTQILLQKRRNQSLLDRNRSDLVQYPASYYNLPLVLRNRLTLGRKIDGGDDGMSVKGKSLRPNSQFAQSSALYFTRETSPTTRGASRFKSSYHGVRESIGKRVHDIQLPSIHNTPNMHETPPFPMGDSPTPLQSCLASPSHPLGKDAGDKNKVKDVHNVQQQDAKQQLTISPHLEYINMVQSVTPGATLPKPHGAPIFDTKKLFINWSLEKVRQAKRKAKGKGKKREEKQNEVIKKLEMQETDKEYVLGRFLEDQSEHSRSRLSSRRLEQCLVHNIKDIQCEQCRKEITGEKPLTSPLPAITKHAEFRKLRFAGLPAEGSQSQHSVQLLSQPMPAGFADTVSDFRQGCYMGTKSFIIRKEQITTSKSFLTVTSLTINKVPSDGFMMWQYKTDNNLLDG